MLSSKFSFLLAKGFLSEKLQISPQAFYSFQFKIPEDHSATTPKVRTRVKKKIQIIKLYEENTSTKKGKRRHISRSTNKKVKATKK